MRDPLPRRRCVPGARAQGAVGRASQHPLGEKLLDKPDGTCWVETLRTDIGAVHDGVAAKQPVRILEVIETLLCAPIAAIREEPPGLEERRRTEELVGIPPE